MRTTDGGATWAGLYSRKVDSAGWTTVGLDVTTTYGVHFDPFDSKRMFITYTDIGLFRSEDGGGVLDEFHDWSSAGVDEHDLLARVRPESKGPYVEREQLYAPTCRVPKCGGIRLFRPSRAVFDRQRRRWKGLGQVECRDGANGRYPHSS